MEWLTLCIYKHHAQNNPLPVQLNISTYLDSILPCSNYCTDYIGTQISTTLIQTRETELRKMNKHAQVQNSVSRFDSDSCESNVPQSDSHEDRMCQCIKNSYKLKNVFTLLTCNSCTNVI